MSRLERVPEDLIRSRIEMFKLFSMRHPAAREVPECWDQTGADKARDLRMRATAS